MQKKRSYNKQKSNNAKMRQYDLMKLFWLFLLASFGGAVVEIFFCFATTGRFMSRSSVVFGQFSLVWGLGVVLFTVALYGMQNKNDRYIFFAGTFLGGVFEYLCSITTEILFGSVFWDYSGFKLNIGGRINLLFCLAWGVVALLWVKCIYPFLSVRVDKIVQRAGRPLTAALAVLMLGNMLLSTAALDRYIQRQRGQGETTEMDVVIDKCFPDSRMQERYPSLKMRRDDGTLCYPGRNGAATLKTAVSGQENDLRPEKEKTEARVWIIK